MNLTVLDHIAAGRRTLADANRLDAEGTARAHRRAEALRTAQTMKSEALLGDATTVRTMPCPACGCYSLLMHAGRAVCSNRHCAPKGAPLRRSWSPLDLAAARPSRPKGVRRSAAAPRDLIDLASAVPFFAPTGYPMSRSTLHRTARLYELPTWRRPGSRAVLYSLSDLMTAHAVKSLDAEPAECVRAGFNRPACSGLADLFFGEYHGANPKREAAAKELCADCPLRQPCLEQALAIPGYQQHGIFGGLNAAEREELQKTR